MKLWIGTMLVVGVLGIIPATVDAQANDPRTTTPGMSGADPRTGLPTTAPIDPRTGRRMTAPIDPGTGLPSTAPVDSTHRSAANGACRSADWLAVDRTDWFTGHTRDARPPANPAVRR